MSVSLITDGVLYPLPPCYVPIAAPSGAEAVGGTLPVVPCDPVGYRTNQPPAVPRLTEATQAAAPVPPCGSQGFDPTISPPAVPMTPTAYVMLNGAPSVPICAEGHVS